MKSFYTTITAFAISLLSLSQEPTLAWEQSYGGTNSDKGQRIIAASDGGFIMIGSSMSSDEQVSDNHGGSDIWVLKLDQSKQLVWDFANGYENLDYGVDVLELENGNILCLGNVTNKGTLNGTIFCLDMYGNILWQQNIVGNATQFVANKFLQTNTGEVFVAGYTQLESTTDAAIMVFSMETGESLFGPVSYGGSGMEYFSDIAVATNGNIVAVGATNSTDGDVQENQGDYDLWVVELSPTDGSMLSGLTYGGSNADGATAIQSTNDNYFIVGTTHSMDGDVTVNHGGEDIWFMNLDSNFELVTEKTFGGLMDEAAQDVFYDGLNIAIVGSTYSLDGDIDAQLGSGDLWLLSIAPNGVLHWEKTFGGTALDAGNCVLSTTNPSLLILGFSASNDIDVEMPFGSEDFWLIEIETPVGMNEEVNTHLILNTFPNPATNELTVSSRNVISALQITNTFGQVVFTHSGELNLAYIKLDIFHLEQGIYFVTIKTSYGLTVQRFVKQ